MHDQADLGGRNLRLADGVDDAEGLVLDGGRGLGDTHPRPHIRPFACVDQDQVSEGAAHIDAGDHRTRIDAFFLIHWENPECETFFDPTI